MAALFHYAAILRAHSAQDVRSTYNIRLQRPRPFNGSGTAVPAVVVDGVAGVKWNVPIKIWQLT